MRLHEIATNEDVLSLRCLIEQISSKSQKETIVEKRAYSRKEACMIPEISEKEISEARRNGNNNMW
ncbi:MAG: hypothetical protein KAK04_06730 [Cyclobacteriaceae bacterium]|nr:hypothetical protein [Cyclobacteriaceae bacterium]